MKKLIAITFVSFSLASYAQDTTRTTQRTTTTTRTTTQTQDDDKWWNKDGAMMKNGKVYTKVNGEKKELTENLALNNGGVVMPNGTVKMKDGSTKTLSNGQCIDLDGNIRTKDDKKSMK